MPSGRRLSLHSGATEWRSEGELRRLNLDLGAELDHAIRRNVEVIHDVAGVARHGGKEPLAPQRHAVAGGRNYGFAADKE